MKFFLSTAVLSLVILQGPARAANVTVNIASNLFPVAGTAYGIHTSVYDNQNGNAALPGRLVQSGVNTLRYPGGGYADVYHWSKPSPTTPFFGGSGGYVANGTDFGSFAQLLTNASAQAVITVNYGSSLNGTTGGQPQEAAAWVAYANGDASIYGTANDITIGVDAEGNNWRTVGYWAHLRTLTPASNPDNQYDFLAINRAAPIGVKYWEIGNETFGDGYYNQSPTNSSGFDPGYSENLFAPYGIDRRGVANLSPAFYGQKVNEYAAAMKAVDPTIKIGTVLSTPPDDYSWDYYQRYDVNYPYSQINGPSSGSVKHWNAEVLAQCASNTDFVIAHWYPYIGDSSNGSNLLWFVRGKLPQMVNGSTSGLDTGGNAGLRDWIKSYRPTDGTNVEIFITEFNFNGSLATSVIGPANALFAADSYATWMDLGVDNIDYLEMNKTPFLGDSASLTRGEVYYAIQMVRKMADPGDKLIATSSDQATLRAHAAMRKDGKLGLLLINADGNNNQTVNVSVSNGQLMTSGTRYQFGTNNFPVNVETPSSPPSTNAVSGLGNSFAVTVPAYTMVTLTIPLISNTPPTLLAISDQTVNVGQPVAFTASATDTDSPPQTLTFTLLSGPTNATLDSGSGAFSWRPLVTQADTTNIISLKVADSGVPSLSATQNFSAIVNPLTIPTVSPAGFADGQFTLQVDGDSGPDYALQVSTNLTDWNTLLSTNSPAMPFQWTESNAMTFPMQFYRVKVGPPLE
jgi:hypothetical protein